MFSSGSREGEDLRRAWNSLQEEERQAAHWLEVGMQDNLSGGVEEVGGVSCDGSTGGNCQRSETSTELELSKKDLRCILARIEQTDRFGLVSKGTSCQLQALPSPDTSLSSDEFSGAAAVVLCLPSPACSDRLSQVIRGA